MPVIATANAGRVTSNDIVTIEASGKASLIGLSAGATAAAPIRTIIEEQSSVISVSLLGLNPFLISLNVNFYLSLSEKEMSFFKPGPSSLPRYKHCYINA
jgi:hypothetical protein